MTTQAPNAELFKTWKEMYDQFEKTWTQPMQEMLGSESFVASMSATRESYLTNQDAMREGMEQYLKSLRLPSKTDFARLAGQVVALETKIEAIEDRFDTLEAKLDTLIAAVSKLAVNPPAPIVEVVVPPADEPKNVAPQPSTKRRRAK
ncbi:MAG TPA: hypothetical protein V6D05_00615 [Stenomitos sp.]